VTGGGTDVETHRVSAEIRVAGRYSVGPAHRVSGEAISNVRLSKRAAGAVGVGAIWSVVDVEAVLSGVDVEAVLNVVGGRGERQSLDRVGEYVAHDLGVFEQFVVRVTPLGAPAAVAGLLDDVEERVLFEEVSDPP